MKTCKLEENILQYVEEVGSGLFDNGIWVTNIRFKVEEEEKLSKTLFQFTLPHL